MIIMGMLLSSFKAAENNDEKYNDQPKELSHEPVIKKAKFIVK